MIETATAPEHPTAARPTGVALIVNGDDFGLSPAVNRAVIRAHREGVLTSASLMVNEPAAGEAVEMARENPGLAVGLHLVLAHGRAALPHTQIPHITGRSGRFTDSSFRAGLGYYFSPAARREMRREVRAQFERFAATGLPLSHVDGHTHLHMHPTVFKHLVELCEEYGVRRVRVVRDDLRLNLKLDRSDLALKLVWGVVFNLLSSHCERRLRARGFTYPERVYGLFQTGKVDEEYLLGLLPRMGRVASEIYAHPLEGDDAEAERGSGSGGARELRALTSERVRRAVEDAGFELSTYERLAGGW
jgi:chitin disaccharide deacetylase